MSALEHLMERLSALRWREEGAIGWLLLGIIAGIGLVIYGVYVLIF